MLALIKLFYFSFSSFSSSIQKPQISHKLAAVVLPSCSNSSIMGGVFEKMLNTFFSKKLEVVLVGLENSGKTTLLQVKTERM